MADNLSEEQSTEGRKFVYSTADTYEFFGITEQSLFKWRSKGAPQVAPGEWDIQALMNWRYGAESDTDNPAARKLKAEADLKEAKAAQEKIKLGVKQEEFVAAEFAEHELTRLFANMKKSLLAISHNVAADLAAIDPGAAETAKGIVDGRVREALLEMSEGRLYRRGKKKIQ